MSLGPKHLPHFVPHSLSFLKMSLPPHSKSHGPPVRRNCQPEAVNVDQNEKDTGRDRNLSSPIQYPCPPPLAYILVRRHSQPEAEKKDQNEPDGVLIRIISGVL